MISKRRGALLDVFSHFNHTQTMHPTRRLHRFALFATPALFLAVAACDGSTDPDVFATDELTAELAITPDHVHAFETTVTFTVAVTDPNGDPVTDFDVLNVERKKTTAASYSLMATTLAGAFYSVDYLFEGSGQYEIRVSGQRPGDAAPVIMYELPTPLEAVRPHFHVGGYEVRIEPSPGHIHAGNTSDVQFWVLDPTTEAGITGLAPTLFVQDPTGAETALVSTEGADGLYHGSHTFGTAGDWVLGIRFTGTDAAQHEATLDVEVHAPH
jgi:hypothetical protein